MTINFFACCDQLVHQLTRARNVVNRRLGVFECGHPPGQIDFQIVHLVSITQDLNWDVLLAQLHRTFFVSTIDDLCSLYLLTRRHYFLHYQITLWHVVDVLYAR